MLTTEDNPFNPWTQYELWRRWDIDHGYNIESYIASLMIVQLKITNMPGR